MVRSPARLALLVALLALSAIPVFVLPPVSATGPQRHFGFWVSGNVMGPPFYTPTQFADAMFLTPPYPSSAEFMMYGAYKDIGEGYTNPATAPDVSHDISNLLGVAAVADQYPNIEIEVMVALGDLGDPLALTYFQYYVDELASHPSIYSIGLEGEYSSNVTVAYETPLMDAALAAGKQYIDYYKTSGIGPLIAHTNWPDGDFEALLGGSTSSGDVGISSGYDSIFPFPGVCSLPSNPDTYNPSSCGWTQSEVAVEFQYAINVPIANRQFVHLVAGAVASNESFTGVSGVSTTEMWDNPTLRNWIWTDPNYQGNFVLSTSSGTSSTSTTSSSSSSTTISSSSINTTSLTSQTSSQSSAYTSTATAESSSSYSAGQGSLSVAYLLLPVAIVLVGTGMIFLGPRFRRRRTRKSVSAAG